MLFFYYMYVACNSGVCLRNILSIIWKVTWWSVQFLYIKSSPVIEHCFWWPEHLSGSNYIYRDVVSIGPLQIPSLHTLNGKIIMCKDDKLYPKNPEITPTAQCIHVTMWKQVASDFVTLQKSMSYIWQCGRDLVSPFSISGFFFIPNFFLHVVKSTSWGIQKSIFDGKESGSQFASFNWIL